MSLFVDPATISLFQLWFQTGIYGYILYTASELISTGSELLLLIPSVASIVGSVVLPTLGAVPDGMMVLFSGIGDDVEYQVSVGVGTLAGSTVMLLTVPFFCCCYFGRVDIVNNVPQYTRPRDAPANWAKLTDTGSSSDKGIAVKPAVAEGAKFMLVSMLSYFIIFVPSCYMEMAEADARKQAKTENIFALIGCITCAVAFFWYLYIQFRGAEEGDNIVIEINVITEAIKRGEITLRGAMADIYNIGQKEFSFTATASRELEKPLLQPESLFATAEQNKRAIRRMIKILAPFFQMYDVNKDNSIDFDEFCMIINDLNERALSTDHMKSIFLRADADRNGSISFEEFVACMIMFALGAVDKVKTGAEFARDGSIHDQTPMALMERTIKERGRGSGNEEENLGFGFGSEGSDSDESEVEDIPEDLAGLSVDEQQRRIKRRAAWKLGLGSLLLLLFADPMVECMGEIGTRLYISPFFVSFVLAPVASNASECVSAYNYAIKRTVKMTTVAIQVLFGAAIMNNTFCLCIFLLLIYWRSLVWCFTAEFLSLLIVEIFMGWLCINRTVIRLPMAWIVLSLYPLSMILVLVLQALGIK